MRRRGVTLLAAVSFGLAGALCSALALGGLTVVTTRGVSMQPTYAAGDLVLLAPARSYDVGEVIAYRDDVHHLVVLHRVVVSDPSGYRVRGDDNASVDAAHPTRSEVLGRVVLHVPQAGTWLHRLLPPLLLTVLAVALALGGSTRVRRRPRRQPMSRHTTRTRSAGLALPESGRRLAAAAAAAGVVGLALGALSWTAPVTSRAPGPPPPVGTMTFSYHADVGRSPAYDDTTVHAPDPVFRRLASTVEVGLGYVGGPGSVTVRAELSTASGWHSTVPLLPSRPTAGGRYEGAVRLVLPELERRARAAAEANGIPAGPLAIAVTAAMTGADADVFAPSLRLALTPQALTLVGPASLTVVQPAGDRGRTDTVPATRRLLGHDLPVEAGRVASAALVLVSVLTGLALLVIARRGAPADESTAIRRRYASALVSVHPMASPAGRSIVDVTRFADLVGLAERQALPVLHWTRSSITTFVVHDHDTDYRYRTGTDPSPVAA